jgi:hypothetical protein
LVNAMLSGGLVAIDIQTGERFTAEYVGGICFFCEKDIDKERPVCFHLSDLYRDKSRVREDKPIYCGDMHQKRFFTNRDRVLDRVDTIKEKMFLLAEVEAYEQAHGLGPLPHAPESAEALAETLRAAGITEAGMIARMVKAAFPETTLPEIGALVTGKPDDKGNRAANTKAAQRALNPK